MFRTVMLVFLSASCAADPLENPLKVQELDPHIVGGSNAIIEDYPYQVSLLYLSSFICGASIINEHWALSSALCVSKDSDYRKYSIRAGSSYYFKDGKIHNVAKVISHEKFNKETRDFDFALLKVSTPFVFGNGVAVIELPVQGQNTAADSNATASGWGALSAGGQPSHQLQVTTLAVTLQRDCRVALDTLGGVTGRMICAGKTQDATGGICAGDGGGPLVLNETLIGVASWGSACAVQGKPGVYAKVSSVRDWIDATAAATSVSPVNLLATFCLVVGVGVVRQSYG